MRALSVAATGMDAQQTNLEVIANNIANINTTGYKRARADFADFLYQTGSAQAAYRTGPIRLSCRKVQYRSRRPDSRSAQHLPAG